MCAKAQGLSLRGKGYAGKRGAWSGAEFLNSTLLAFGAGSLWEAGCSLCIGGCLAAPQSSAH